MKKISMFLLSLGAILSFTTFLASSPVNASCAYDGSDRTLLGIFRSWDYGLTHIDDGKGTAGTCHVVIPKVDADNPSPIPSFVWAVVLNVFFDISIIAGIVAVIMIIYNGIQYMTSGGSSDKVSNAKKGLTQSIIGLAITILAATIINFIVGLF